MVSSPASLPHPQGHQPLAPPSFTAILTVVLLVTFFVAFFFFIIFKCFADSIISNWYPENNNNSLNNNNPTPTDADLNLNPGLDPSLIELFPLFMYSVVKDLKEENQGLECAICLCEFEEDDVIRLITGCNHVFHQDCIDHWLQSHKTCPVCRRDLEKEHAKTFNSQEVDSTDNQPSDDNPTEHVINIDTAEGQNNTRDNIATSSNIFHSKSEGNIASKVKEKFSRSCSAGRNRYTLRLPENVKIEFTRGHSTTLSCITFGDVATPSRDSNSGHGNIHEDDVHRV